jgi:hypothetical protein
VPEVLTAVGLESTNVSQERMALFFRKVLDGLIPNYGRYKSRGSAVGIPTRYGQDDRGVEVRFPVKSRILSSPYRPDRLWDPPSPLSNGYWRLFPLVKRPGREADHSTRAKVKKTWIYTSIPLYVFMA